MSETTTTDPRENVDLEGMTRAQLLGFALEHDIDVPAEAGRRKGTTLAAINGTLDARHGGVVVTEEEAPHAGAGEATLETTGETSTGDPADQHADDAENLDAELAGATVVDAADDAGETSDEHDDAGEPSPEDGAVSDPFEGDVVGITEDDAPALTRVVRDAGIDPARVLWTRVHGASVAVAYADRHGTPVGRMIPVDEATLEAILGVDEEAGAR